MDLKGYFFNSKIVDGEQDRKYNAEDFCNYLEKIVGNGVFSNPSTNLQVSQMGVPTSTVYVKPGQGWIEGHKFVLEKNVFLDVEAAASATFRKDRVVVACDYAQRMFRIYIKKGTPVTGSMDKAVAPAITRNGSIFELGLAVINVSHDSGEITNAKIQDTRADNAVCGFVSCLIDQVDTTTLFQQYEAQMAEMQEGLKTGFDVWFENLTQTLVSNTIFIEKKAVYKTTSSDEKTIVIPESLLYGDALDVLHVFINGMRLVEGVEYTKTDSTITFTNALPVKGTVVEITNWKTAGSGSVQEIASTVLTLEEEMRNIRKYRYICTGTNDNVKIMNIVNDFLNSRGDFASGSAYEQMQLQIVGSIKPATFTSVSGTNGKSLFMIESNSARKVVLDFANAGIEIAASSISGMSLDAIFDLSSNVTLKDVSLKLTIEEGGSSNNFAVIRTSGDVTGGNLIITNASVNTTIGVKATNPGLQTIEKVEVDINSTSINSVSAAQVGFEGRASYSDSVENINFLNCKASIQAPLNTNYKMHGFRGVGNFESCNVYIYNRGTALYSDVIGFFNEQKSFLSNCHCYVTGTRVVKGFDGNGNYVNCKAHAASNGEYACQGFFINGSATNCEGIGRNASNNGSGYGFFMKDNTATLRLVNCTGYGYKSAFASGNTVYAYGISANGSATTQTLVCIGCQVPKSDRTNFVQEGSIFIPGTDSGASATLVGNILFTGITKHKGSNITENGNII